MTEKQIYNRLNRCYLNCMVDNKEQINTDEWYGTDDIKDWEWHRPGNDKYYRIYLNPDSTITCYEKDTENGEYHITATFSNKDYMFEPEPSLSEECDEEPEI